MIQNEDHRKEGDAPESAAGPSETRYELERQEPLEKAQRNMRPREEAGGPWTELEGHDVQRQPVRIQG